MNLKDLVEIAAPSFGGLTIGGTCAFGAKEAVNNPELFDVLRETSNLTPTTPIETAAYLAILGLTFTTLGIIASYGTLKEKIGNYKKL